MVEKMKFIGGVNFEELRAQRVQVYNVITLNLATARTDQEFVYTGTYIYAIDATDIDTVITLKLNEKFRGPITFNKGRGVRAPFYRFYLTNTAQAGKTITLAIGVESETFEVLDVGKALEISGEVYDSSWYKNGLEAEAFCGYIYISPAAGKKAACQLWNPAASGVNLYLNKISGTSEGAQAIIVRKWNAKYTTDYSLYLQNKFIGAAAPNGEGAVGEDMSGDYFAQIATQSAAPFGFWIEFFPAIVIPPGYGVAVTSATADFDLKANFEWVEKAV